MKIRRLTPRQKFVAFAALLVVSVVCLAFINRNAFAATWTQATTHQSGRYTSLAFLDTGHLPTYAGVGTTHHMTFRISNQETTLNTYQYRVVMSTVSSSVLLKTDTAIIPAGQFADRTIDFSLPGPNMTAQIMVQLVNRLEFITFEVKS